MTTDNETIEIGELNMLIAQEQVLDPFEAGDIITADSYTALVDSLAPGYIQAEQDTEQMHLRALAMARIANRLQDSLARGHTDLPQWVTQRNFLDEVEIDTWDHHCPLVVIADAQTNVAVPEGNVTVLTFKDELLFITSLARAGLVRIFEKQD